MNPIHQLVRRLSDALWITWPAAWRWHAKPAESELVRAVTQSKDAIEAIRVAGDWRAIPSLVDVLAHSRASLRDAASVAIDELAARIPVQSLINFEQRLRDSSLQTLVWGQLQVTWVTKQDWPPRVWALFTMHPNGFVREAAVRRLASFPKVELILPYTLLRVNDWVSQVREIAIATIKRYLEAEHISSWVPLLGVLDQLRRRSRADHAWVVDGVMTLLSLPECRATLAEATRSADPFVARSAFRVAMELSDPDRAPFVHQAIGHHDAVVRLRAAKIVRIWRSCPRRGELLKKMAADRFMPIRRESLYAAVEDESHPRRIALRGALLDRHSSMRDAARFYLREFDGVSQVGESRAVDQERFDAREFYINALSTVFLNGNLSTQAAAIAGLGECGDKGDVERLWMRVGDDRASIAAVTVRAIASLDRENQLEWFVDLLSDARPAVARAAFKALMSAGNVLPRESLREVLEREQSPRARLLALKVLLQGNLYDTMPYAVMAAGSDHAALVQTGTKSIRRAAPWRVSYPPRREQQEAVIRAMQSLPRPLPADIHRSVRDVMHLDPA